MMKKVVQAALSFSLFFLPPAFSAGTDTLDDVSEQTQDIYRTRSGAENATFNTVGKSMIAWGIGLSAAIAILASAIHQSNKPQTTSSSSSTQ